jgi:hypothetical protein
VSKTDKTRPVRVQMTQGDRTYYAVHSRECMDDSKNCNLPEQPDPHHPTARTPDQYRIWSSHYRPGMFFLTRVQCYWSPDPYIGKHFRIKSDCGCKQCTMQDYRRRGRRRDRHIAKTKLKKGEEL